MENDICEGDDVIISGKVTAVLDIDLGVRYLVVLPSNRRVIVGEMDIKSYRPEVKVDGEDHRKGN